MTTQQLNPRVIVYLTSSRDWDSWFLVAKVYSLALEIWDYMNSDNPEECILPTEPSRSAVSQVKAGATMVIDIKEDELTQNDYLREIWKKEKAVYEKIDQDLLLFYHHLL